MAPQTKPYADFMKAFSDFKMPSFELDSVMSIQKKNLEAFTSAAQVLTDSFQALSRRQAEIIQKQTEDFLATVSDMMTSSSPETSASKQADLNKKLFEQQINSMRELAEMASKSNVEALDIINKRVVKSMEDINGLLKKAA